MRIPSINLSRRGRILLAVSLVLIWILARQHIAQMDDRFFRLSLPGIKGLVLYTVGDYSGAAKAYRAHLEEEFQAGGSTGHTGWDALLRGELGPARHFSQQILEKDPEDLHALLTLGELALMENAPAHALDLFGRVLKKEPEQFDALLLSAIAFARSDDQGRAIHSLNSALRTNRIERRITSFLMTLQETGDLAQRPKGEQPLCLLAHYYRYLRIFDDSNAGPAISYAEKAIVAGDLPANAYLTMGVVYEKQKKRDEALTAFLKAIEHDPRHAEAYRWAATIYSYRGDLPNEYRMWKGSYEAAPDDPMYAIGNISFLYHKVGDMPQALEIALKASERAPQDVTLLRFVASIYKALGEEQPAVDYLQRALLERPDDAEIHSEIGLVYIEAGKYSAAFETFRTALARNPNHPAPHLGLAALHQQQRRFREAIGETEAAIRLGAREPNVRAQLCSLYEWDGHHQQAADCLRIVLRQDPSNQMAINLLPYVQKNLTPEKFR